MGLFSLFRTKPATEHSALLKRYKQLRKLGMKLNDRLAEFLSKDVLEEGGKRLGIFHKNMMVLECMDDIAVLLDYCIHDVRRSGKNAVERFLETSPLPANSDEMILLQAMRQARFAFLLVEAREEGVGVRVRDVLRDESLFLHDIGLGQTCPPGVALAARIMCADDMWMTTGAPLPFGQTPHGVDILNQPEFAEIKKSMRPHEWTPKTAAQFSATILRACLERGATEHTIYQDVEDNVNMELLSPPETSGGWAKRPVGRGNMCRCGSGRKYKRCCGKRR